MAYHQNSQNNVTNTEGVCYINRTANIILPIQREYVMSIEQPKYVQQQRSVVYQQNSQNNFSNKEYGISIEHPKQFQQYRGSMVYQQNINNFNNTCNVNRTAKIKIWAQPPATIWYINGRTDGRTDDAIVVTQSLLNKFRASQKSKLIYMYYQMAR